jgi:two-component system, chemotaxis family, CheB/CheR fusion protein
MPRADLAGRTILVVDDHEDATYVLERVLTSRRATVIAHRNPVAALGYLETSPVDVILSDFSMPQMNGIEFVERIRQTEKNQTTPAIALTGFPEDYFSVRRAGFSAFVRKPINLDKLFTVIADVISRSSAPPLPSR